MFVLKVKIFHWSWRDKKHILLCKYDNLLAFLDSMCNSVLIQSLVTLPHKQIFFIVQQTFFGTAAQLSAVPEVNAGQMCFLDISQRTETIAMLEKNL